MASSNDNDVVNSVLSFWFGEAIFSQSTSMSPRNHPTIEQCITKQYKTLWFSSSKAQTEADHTIKNRFGKLLSDAEQGLLNGWIAEPLSLCALIVVLDQFSRHIYRNVERPPQNDAKALELSELMLKRRWHLYLPVPMEVFSLMPLRHSPTIPRLERVLEEIERRSTSEKASSVLLEKFRRTTVGRLESLKDSSADLCTSSISSSNDDSDENDDILERHPFIADEIKLGKHTLVHCMQQFISTKMVAKRNEIVLAVSLSGGVDSMVIARILVYIRDTFASKMKNSSTASTTSTSSSSSSSTSTSSSSSNKECHLQRLHVIALHIDYGNRNESAKEASYVESWCKQFNITFYKRRIDEVKRGVTSRDEYEKKSRRIRYGFYKEILSKYQESQGIFFGHHRGDVQENVLSNMMRRSSPLNLSGMTSVGLVEGVRIFRPFLEYNKDIIYQFAHEFGVPYFKDTTPKWSVRGKLRNQLMPLLRDIYGAGYLNALSSLAEQSNQLRDMVNKSLFNDFYQKNVKRSPLCVWFHCTPYLSQPLFFWKEVLRDICHSMGSNMISEKSIKEFMTRLRPSSVGSEINKKRLQHSNHISSSSSSSSSGSGGSDKRQQQQFPENQRAIKKQKIDKSSSLEIKNVLETPKKKSIYPRNGWPALKKNSTSFFYNGVLYLFEPIFIESSKWKYTSSFEIDGPNVQINEWNINVRKCQTNEKIQLTMDNVLSGKFKYLLTVHEGQTLCVGQVKGLNHPAGSLDPKFRKMIPFVTVNGKPGVKCWDIVVKYQFSEN